MNNHLQLVHASELAYASTDKIEATVINDWGFNVDHLDRNDSQAFLATNTTRAILAFRGTEKNLADIITDCKGRKVRHSKLVGRGHEGFIDGYSSISREIDTALHDRKVKLGELSVTGHSLAGALAQLFTAMDTEFKPFETVTFGSPRVFDSTAAKWFNSGDNVLIRYENNNDIVPHLPTSLPGWLVIPVPVLKYITPTGYRHAGVRRYIDTCGRIHHEPSVWYRARDSVFGVIEHTGPLFGDHYKEHYHRLIGRSWMLLTRQAGTL